MNPELIARSLPALGLVGSMGLFLPSLDEAWKSDPREPSLLHTRLRKGETLYVGMSIAILGLASYAARSTWPLLIGGGFVTATILTYEHAYRSVPSRDKTGGGEE